MTVNDNNSLISPSYPLGESVLLEIMACLQDGLMKQVDISDMLRKMTVQVENGKVVLVKSGR